MVRHVSMYDWCSASHSKKSRERIGTSAANNQLEGTKGEVESQLGRKSLHTRENYCGCHFYSHIAVMSPLMCPEKVAMSARRVRVGAFSGPILVCVSTQYTIYKFQLEAILCNTSRLGILACTPSFENFHTLSSLHVIFSALALRS